MNYQWLDEYLLAKPGVQKDYKAEWEATRYLLAGKMLAMVGGDKYGKPIITLKLEPAHGELLRNEYADIVPGYYMNKMHWNSVYVEGTVPDDVVRDMADCSYRLVLQTLSAKARREITGEQGRATHA